MITADGRRVGARRLRDGRGSAGVVWTGRRAGWSDGGGRHGERADERQLWPAAGERNRRRAAGAVAGGGSCGGRRELWREADGGSCGGRRGSGTGGGGRRRGGRGRDRRRTDRACQAERWPTVAAARRTGERAAPGSRSSRKPYAATRSEPRARCSCHRATISPHPGGGPQV